MRNSLRTYTVKEIAELLGTNPETVRRWIRSGKLEAIQSSRKEGNVVTNAMLTSFIERTPKYAGFATGVSLTAVSAVTVGMPLLGLAAIGATVASSVKGKALNSIEQDSEGQIKEEEIRKHLLLNIQIAKDNIKEKEKTIDNLQKEIEKEQKYIEETTRILNMLSL